MLKHTGSLSEYSYEQVRDSYPYTQKCIYEALLLLTPERLEFEMNLIPDKRSFCMSGINIDTWEIIGHVMKVLLDNDDLIMTSDDLKLSYSRFREMMFLKAAVEQGLMEMKITDTQIDYFYTIGNTPAVDSGDREERVYNGRRIHTYRKSS